MGRLERTMSQKKLMFFKKKFLDHNGQHVSCIKKILSCEIKNIFQVLVIQNIINFGKKLTSQKEAVDTSVINTEKTNSCFMCTLHVKTNVFFYFQNKVKKT